MPSCCISAVRRVFFRGTCEVWVLFAGLFLRHVSPSLGTQSFALLSLDRPRGVQRRVDLNGAFAQGVSEARRKTQALTRDNACGWLFSEDACVVYV